MFAQKVRDMALAAHWVSPQADARGVFHFSLEGEGAPGVLSATAALDFCIFSPDARTAIVRGVVLPVPQGHPARDALMAYVAATQAGIAVQRPSVVAYEPAGQSLSGEGGAHDTIVIYRSFPFQDADFRAQVRGFLNDFVWWKRACAAFSMADAGEGPPSGMFLGRIY